MSRIVVCLFASLALLGTVGACQRNPAPGAARLVDVFTTEMVEGGAATPPVPPARTEWRFDSGSQPFEVLAGVSGLVVRDGLLSGRTTAAVPMLAVDVAPPDEKDQLYAFEVRLRVSSGANLFLETVGSEELDRKGLTEEMAQEDWTFTTPLVTGEEMRTYTLRSALPHPARGIRHLLLRPSDVAGAEFAIESVRVVFRKEHLASIESGIGFQGMSEIYRESIVSRSPETIRMPVTLPSHPVFQVALGTVDDAPVTFRVEVDDALVAEQTVSTPYRWEERSLDLSRFAGRAVSLSLSLTSEHDGAIGVWGTPVVWQRETASASTSKPRGVILIWTDTLRRDHLDAYGYERETAPNLKRLASEGVLFLDNVSQATWTKVSTPALMTSLYPSTNGVRDFSDHLPASATTLAEVYRDAGYATLSFASNLFTGQFTNLHQGFEELHEDGSLPEQGSSKTARPYVDRLTAWLTTHRDVPFFIFLHVYDAHDPYEPRPPYNSRWADPARKAHHEAELKKVRDVIEDPLAKDFGMPNRDELTKAGIDPDAFVGYTEDWYDGAIRGMDTEIERIVERLRELGLDRDTLIVFAADHGEEFLDHGGTFHGQSVHGELTRVPLLFHWPAGLPEGKSVDTVTQTIDVMPTLLSLSGLEIPKGVQGQSLVPLLEGDGSGFRPRPAISEKAETKEAGGPWPRDTESYSIVDGGYKLIHNRLRKDGSPEFELYDFAKDPLDQTNLASEHPDVVKRLSEALEGWYRMANDARLAPDEANTEGLSQEQLERLRSLGYIR